MLEDLNKTFVALVPKRENTESITKYKPISLCNTTYKILTKILAKKIKPILSSIISRMQRAFIPQRSTTNNIIIVQEVIHHLSIYKSKIPYFLLKVDMEKAFGGMEWSFIRAALIFFKFTAHFI